MGNLFLRLYRRLNSTGGAWLLLTGIIFIVFSPCLSAGFLNWDDYEHMVNNPLLPLQSWSDVLRVFFTGDTANRTYNPLMALSFGVERIFFGLNPLMYHLNNLLLHCAVAVLVRLLAMRMGISPTGALIAAVFFAVHPMRVESVAWVTERKDVLFGLFYVGALIKYWDYVKTASGRPYIGALLCAVCSILAKPMALSLPLVLFLLDRMSQRRFSLTSFMDKVPFMLALWPVTLITMLMNVRHSDAGWLQGVLVMIYSATFYVVKIFLPLNTAIIYPVPRPVSLVTLEYGLAILLLGCVLLWLWTGRRSRWVRFAFAFYVLTMFFLWKTDLFDGAKGIVSDRYTYIPCLGFVLLLGYCWDRFVDKYSSANVAGVLWGKVLVVIILVLVASMTYDRCFSWRDNWVFWNEVLRVDKDNTFALFNRASCLLQDPLVAARYEMPETVRNHLALADLQKAVERAPRDAEIWNNLGVVLERMGRLGEAQAAYAQSDRLGGVNSR